VEVPAVVLGFGYRFRGERGSVRICWKGLVRERRGGVVVAWEGFVREGRLCIVGGRVDCLAAVLIWGIGSGVLALRVRARKGWRAVRIGR
jgi:hypothetical protein